MHICLWYTSIKFLFGNNWLINQWGLVVELASNLYSVIYISAGSPKVWLVLIRICYPFRHSIQKLRMPLLLFLHKWCNSYMFKFRGSLVWRKYSLLNEIGHIINLYEYAFLFFKVDLQVSAIANFRLPNLIFPRQMIEKSLLTLW